MDDDEWEDEYRDLDSVTLRDGAISAAAATAWAEWDMNAWRRELWAPGPCAYVYSGSYWTAPEPCDLDAEEGSEFCARHRAVMEDDNSDEPVWAQED